MNKFNLGVLLIAFIILGSCGKKNTTVNNNVPYVYVSIQVFKSLSENTYLATPGTYKYLTGGYKGIILAHTLDDKYLAFDRTCTFHPETSCAIIELDSATFNNYYCGKKTNHCCDSRYQADGFVVNGPATQPLKSYNVSQDANYIYITN
ncbi:MAG: hypothetical protein H7321_09675 [Bacteroidia bacterium]|nr:hypothetical protein [Bacteroidia bacterium]